MSVKSSEMLWTWIKGEQLSVAVFILIVIHPCISLDLYINYLSCSLQRPPLRLVGTQCLGLTPYWCLLLIILYQYCQSEVYYSFRLFLSKTIWLNKVFRFCMLFHPILVSWFLVVFGNQVKKILRKSLFIFHLVLPCKWKTSYRKSCN